MADQQVTVYKITFGKNRYHQYQEMIEWCEKHVGFGGYKTYFAEDGLRGECKWWIDQVFGNTTFGFSDPRDYSKFVVKWEWTDGKDSSG